MNIRRTRIYILLVLFFILLLVALSVTDYSTTILIIALALAPAAASILLGHIAARFAPGTSSQSEAEPEPPPGSFSLIELLIVTALIGLLAVFTVPNFMSSRQRARARNVRCERYDLSLFFDPSAKQFNGEQKIQLALEIREFNPPATPSSGDTIRLGTGNPVVMALVQAGFDGWTIEEMELLHPKDHEDLTGVLTPYVVQARLKTSTVDVSTRKSGLLRYASEVHLPWVVYGRSSEPKVEVTVLTPNSAYFKHNLNGTASESVLENNEPGQKLIADRIVDPNHVIRFTYPIAILQNEIMQNILTFSWWTVLLGVGSFILGVIGYFVGVFLDVFKDATVKPFATKVLSAIGLVRNG